MARLICWGVHGEWGGPWVGLSLDMPVLSNLSIAQSLSGRGLWAIIDRKVGDSSNIGGDERHKHKGYDRS